MTTRPSPDTPQPPGTATRPGTPGPPAHPRAGVASAVGSRVAALLLGAAGVAWTATPLLSAGWARTALVVAIIAVVAGALRLAFIDIPIPEDRYFVTGPVRAWLSFLNVLRTVPWEEVAVVALVWLEIQHPARPWHTVALGAGLLAYLLTVHIAESGADAGPLLRRQAKVLVLGAVLLAVGAGFAMIPAGGPGAGSAILRLIAAIAVIAATALVLPA
jgi:phosphatidylserine synthase